MYGRRYKGRELTFEPSGGLLHAALVMRDKETGSYWPIMTGEAATGPLEGTRLQELAAGVKARWRDWLRQHPETLVLSVDGVEHVDNNPYDQYMASDSGFRRMATPDKRLPDKGSIWAFDLGGRRFAVPFRAYEGGRALEIEGWWVFLYRPRRVSPYFSTRAWISPGRFVAADGTWLHEPTGGRFDPARGAFVGGSPADPRPLSGFDTFWYTWSLTHPDTHVIGPTR